MANPTLLEMPIARDGAKNSIPSTTSPTTGLLSQQYGWQDINSMPVQQGGKAPSRLDFNGVLNLLSNILFYAQKGCQFEWDSNQAYYAGCIVKDTSDNKMYMCLNDITSTTAPHADTTNWKVWDLSMLADYLPLSGGAMTGDSISHANSNRLINIAGRQVEHAGAYINLFGGEDNEADPLRNGFFQIIAQELAGGVTNTSILTGTPTGGLTWNGNNLAGSSIVAKSTSGLNKYWKFASGQIIQTGVVSVDANTTSKTINLPISFSSRDDYSVSYSTNLGTSNGHTSKSASSFTAHFNSISSGQDLSWIAIGI